MNYRKLRIVWSVAWGVVAVLLCTLWIRSYWHTDSLTRVGDDSILTRLGTNYGILFWGWADYKTTPNLDSPHVTDGWEYQEYDSEPNPHVAPTWAFNWNATDTIVSLPAWFAAALSLVLAASPWLRPRFSMRSLLIATTLIAVVLGLVVWVVR
jgi:hypothetical protein